MDTNILRRLQSWHQLNCDGDWEHSYGVTIQTLDNPGWSVKVDLENTCLQNAYFKRKIEISEQDWLYMKIENRILTAAGDTTKLEMILTIFLDEIIPNYVDKNFEYEVFILLKGLPVKVWRPVKAILISDDEMEITQLIPLDYKMMRTETIEEFTFTSTEIESCVSDLRPGDRIKVTVKDLYNGLTRVAVE